MKQDHLELQILNYRQCETVKEYTLDDVKTEDIIQLQSNSFNNSNSIQKDLTFLDNKQDIENIYLEQQKQEQGVKDEINTTIEQLKNTQQQSNSLKRNAKMFSKNFDLHDQNSNEQEIGQKEDKQDEQIQVEMQNPQRLIKSINLLVNVKSFYRLLTRNSRIFGKLTKEQHYLINDVSSVFQKNKIYQMKKINQYFSRIKKPLFLFINQIRKFLNQIPMFQPYNLYKFLWDILQAILILSVIFLFSLVKFFMMLASNYSSFFQFVFVIFFLDVIFTFNTGLVQKGNVIFDRKKAAVVYLKKNFIMDLLGILPLSAFVLDIQLLDFHSWILYFFIPFKLFVLSDTFSRLTYYLSYQKNLKNVVDLVKLVFIIACVCHFFCLFWHGLAIYEINLGFTNTWLQIRKIEDADVFTRYVQSFYYLAVTMITVGYGDITPQTTYEILFTTITMFVTGFFYAFSLNKIGSIIENIEMKDKNYKENMQIIHRLMREENVSQTLRVQVSNYLKYLYKESNQTEKQHEIEIINKLSKQLKYDLTQEIQGKYLKDIEIIDKLQTKSKIIEIMEECLFSPGEYIFKQGDIDDCSLYYIVKGSVKISFEYEYNNQIDSLEIAQLKKCQYFGDMQFIQGNARILTAQASDFCRTYKIPRQQFFNCIKQSEQDFENFQMLKDAYIFKENLKLFQIKCYTCNKSDHISIKCPKTHLTLSKQTLIQKENKSTPHLERQNQKRNLNKYNSICNNFDVLFSVYSFIEKDENQQQIKQLEDEMHLSQDETQLEQQLLQLQQEDLNDKISSRAISEEDQETDEEGSSYKDNNSISQNQNSFENQSNLSSGNQQNKIESTLVDSNSQNEYNYQINNHDEILNQSIRKKQKNLSLEKIQSTNNSGDQQDQSHQKNLQTIDNNTNLSMLSLQEISKQKNQNLVSEKLLETQENISSQFQNILQGSNRNIQNLENVQLDIHHRAQAQEEIGQKYCIHDQKQQINQQDIMQQSEISMNSDLSKSNLDDQYLYVQKNSKAQHFAKRKYSSLTNLNELQVNQQAVDNSQNQVQQITKSQKENVNSRQNSQNYQGQNHSKKIKQQILRSQTYGGATSCFKGNQDFLKADKKYPQQTNNFFNKSIHEGSCKQHLEESLLKQYSSQLNTSFSKQMMSQYSQCSLKSAIKKEMTIQRREQMLQRQDIKKQKSQNVNVLRQLQRQQRFSQTLSSNLYDIQQQHLNAACINYLSQQTQNSQQLIYSENHQKTLKKNQSNSKIQNNNQNKRPSYLNQLHLISLQMKNSPLIQYRRQQKSIQNMRTQTSKEINKKANQNSMVFENQENSKTLLEVYKKKPTFHSDINTKESFNKQLQGSKFEMSQQQLLNNSTTQNYLIPPQNQYLFESNATGQDNYIFKQTSNSNYFMLQVFDKPNIFKYYYPMQNINIVLQNLKQNDLKLKKKLSLSHQVTLNIMQNKQKLQNIIKKDFNKSKFKELKTIIN